MCGICGIYSFQGEAPVVVDAMNDAMVHRGPDDAGTFTDGPVALGMRRLSIIGVGNGHQPIFNEDRTVAVVMNGEIYNYLELKTGLEERGHRFSTDADTEVLVHLYEEHGAAFVDHLRGMFAIALWDLEKQRLLVFRDRPGKKPLYWAEHDGHLVFASEIKALHASGLVPKELEPSALRSYLAFGFVVGQGTLFRHVQKLPAGYLMEIGAGGRSLHRYWDSPAAGTDQECDDTFEQAAERLRHLLEEGVRKRLMSEVPLGAFLSGGVDSSAVVAIMRHHFDHELQTFSVGFADPRIDESRHAREVAEHFGTRHHELVLSGCNLAVLRAINHFYDEPAGDPAAVPTYCLSKFARRHITVALTGEGGDEIFAGYRHHRHAQRIGQLERWIPGFRRLARLAAAGEPVLGSLVPPKLWKGLWLAGLPAEERARGWSAAFTDRELAPLLRPETAAAATLGAVIEPLHRLQARVAHRDPLTQLLYVDAFSGLADQLLMKVDKMGMAASLEARCPLLDQDFVEYAATLPSHYKLGPEGGKRVFRRALDGLIPRQVLDRPKQGFDVPLGEWLENDLRPVVDHLLLAEGTALDRWLEPAAIRGLWRRHAKQRDERLAFQLWRLLNLALWLELHWPSGRLDEAAAAPGSDASEEALFTAVRKPS